MSANMKTEQLALWIYLSHVIKEQNHVTPHPTSPSPKNTATVLGKGGHPFFLPTQVINEWGGGWGSVVLLLCTSRYLWAA